MNNNIREEVYFSNENIFEIISEILHKNGLEETLDDAADIENDEDSLISTVLNLTKDFVRGKILEKNLIDSLQKKLGVSQETAKSIFQEVKERILPQAEKIKIDTPAPEKTNENQNAFERPFSRKQKVNEGPTPLEKNEETIPQLKQSKGPDSYREPIE